MEAERPRQRNGGPPRPSFVRRESMRTILPILAFTVLAALPETASAQTAKDLDCGRHLKAAQSAIDKVTEDTKGMEHMPKDQLGHVNTLLREAKDLSRDRKSVV